jgi:glycosyltransferase involved in cell wall biosynthesis
MRFLYSHRTRSADGQYVHIAELTRALSARGHDVIVAGPDNETAAKPMSANAGGVRAKTFLPGPIYECAEYGYSLLAMRKLVEKARSSVPDVIYERYNLFHHAGVWAARRLALPLILEVNAPLAEERAVHGRLSLKDFARWSEARIWRAADMVLPVTNALADYVRASGVPEERIAVIQNGVGADFLDAVDPAPVRTRYGLDGKLVIGFAGFVRDWHRVDRVLRFLAKSERSDLHFLLVGDGPARANLEATARDMGVSDRMTIAGVVQREGMPGHIAAFDVAVQPAATTYASPLKLFEYMALGRSIVAPAQANVRDALEDGREALLFDAKQDGAFDDALGRLVESEDLRAQLGAAARERLIRGERTWERNARKVEAIAETLIGRE